MLTKAPVVVSVLVVVVSLDTLPVAATDAADTDPAVGIDHRVIAPVAVIVEADENFYIQYYFGYFGYFG